MIVKKERDIIYSALGNNVILVDAGDSYGLSENKPYKIGLYHPKTYKTETIELDLGLDINEAETYGVLNAIIYAINNELENVMIVSDSKSACENIKILDFANSYNIKISWIPRELNVVADKMTKLVSTTKKQNINNLKLIYKLVIGNHKNEILKIKDDEEFDF